MPTTHIVYDYDTGRAYAELLAALRAPLASATVVELDAIKQALDQYVENERDLAALDEEEQTPLGAAAERVLDRMNAALTALADGGAK